MATVAVRNAPAGSTANAATYASGSFTPTAGELLVACAYVTDSLKSGWTAPSGGRLVASANGLTFTRVATALDNAGTGTLMVFIANQPVPASPVAMTCTVDVTGDAGTGCGMVIYGVGSMGAGRYGMQAVKGITFGPQSTAEDTGQRDRDSGAGGAAPTVTFPNAATTTNPVLVCCANATSPAGLTPPSSFTEGVDVGNTVPTFGFESAYRASGHTAAGVTWGSNSASAWATLGIELDASAVTSSGKNVALIVGDKAALTVMDIQLKTMLEIWGHTVTAVSDDDAVSGGKDLHYMTESNSGATLSTKYVNIATPVVSHEVGYWATMGMTSTAGTNQGSAATGFDLLTHAITSGLPDPTLQAQTSVGRYGNVIATDFGAGVEGVASPVGIATAYCIFAYDVGDALRTGGNAVARQAGIGAVDSASYTLSWDGIILFGEVAEWAMTAPPANGAFSGFGVPIK